METMDIVNRYVSVWNEPDACERRRRIRSLWAADGTTCHRPLDAHGYEAIEARVTAFWGKWLRDGKYIFRPKPDVVCHHGVVKVNWEMVTVPDGKLQATGLSFLALNSREQIQHDYQFNPTATDAEEFDNLVRLTWHVRPTRGGEMAAAGSDLLVLDEHGRIHAEYRYEEQRTT